MPPGEVESPSGLFAPGAPRGRAMTEADIADTIAAYGSAAATARDLGFDIVELHAAHGYLIDQFFWSETNLRSDPFGGRTLRERTRFAAEIVKHIRARVGGDFPLSLRISQWKGQDYAARLASTPDELADWLLPLAEAGVDVFHCSQRRFWEPEFPALDGQHGLNLAGWVKKVTGATTISVGSVGLSGEIVAALGGESSSPTSLDALIRRMERGEFDLVAVGRSLLVDPSWVVKIRAGDRAGLKGFERSALGVLS
jgi:2,4-dienoyl-CoA reductase-like NADH-dependent reductase (Old Yellow Enzyme family)